MAPHFLDQVPLRFSDPAVKELRLLLSGTFFRSAQVIPLIREAGASPAYVSWDLPMYLAWDEVLDTLQRQGKLQVLLQNLIDGPDVALAERLRELVADQPIIEAPSASTDELDLSGLNQDGFERIIGSEPTLLDVSFLQRGIELASAVVRLSVGVNGGSHLGTGFRIGDDLLVSNHHVLYGDSGTPATWVNAWFGFERSFDGQLKTHTEVPCDAGTIAGDPVHDWAVIRLAEPAPEATAVVSLAGAPPVKVDDRVYIIQHPQGGPKKIGMVHNVVRYVDDDVLRYLTDTESGSSGSPVFNENWQLVGLHHKWGKAHSGSRREFYNQGRRVERVVAGLAKLGIS
jgi:V8-like Glu-specific endopeptidase